MSEKKLELLLEIFSEEIPARFQRFAAAEMERLASGELEAFNLQGLEISTECAPKRLVLCVHNLPESLPEFSEEIRGPRITAPQNAVEGFMGKYSISSLEELEIKGEFYFYNKVTPARQFESVCANFALRLLKSFTWSKSMRWGQSGTDTWVRPVRSIICLLGGKVIHFEYAGVKSGNYSFGHRIVTGGVCEEEAKFDVASYKDYLIKLKNYNVILDFEERKKIVMNHALEVSKARGAEILRDDALFEEVLGLSEFPNPTIGVIDQRFMSLPVEVLVSTIRLHQKYIMFHKKGNSTILSPFFLIVADGRYNNFEKIVKGNERVLAARLSDADFFYNNDLNVKLASRLDALKNRVFHSKIGSIYDKIERMRVIGAKVASYFNVKPSYVDTAIKLCKCDLVSEMVFEFPELQGIMGYYYAISEGIAQDIALAIKEHYKPQGPNDEVPSNALGAVVAIADKLDSLIELFKIGVKPTGNKDPFAQRRAAIGILRILEYYKVEIPVDSFVKDNALLNFINERRSA